MYVRLFSKLFVEGSLLITCLYRLPLHHMSPTASSCAPRRPYIALTSSDRPHASHSCCSLSSHEYEWPVFREGVLTSPPPLPVLVPSAFENGEEKALWNLSKRCGLGWACMGASVPKNGNNRPLSLPLENFFPPKFLSFSLCRRSPGFWLPGLCHPLQAATGRIRGNKGGEVCSGVDVRCEHKSAEDTSPAAAAAFLPLSMENCLAQ